VAAEFASCKPTEKPGAWYLWGSGRGVVVSTRMHEQAQPGGLGTVGKVPVARTAPVEGGAPVLVRSEDDRIGAEKQ